MTTTIAVFTRDLRVHDNPMLAAAARGATHVVPLFVRDDRITGSEFAAGRRRFLNESLTDLDGSLRGLGGRLVVRDGDPVAEICRVATEVSASRVHIAADVSAFAQARESALRSALPCELRRHDDVHTVVPPGAVTPAGKDHFAVFSAYHRQWTAFAWRRQVPTPARLTLPRIRAGAVLSTRGNGFPGGETAARKRVTDWLRSSAPSYADLHDQLAADGTSRLSPYLHLGCVSALELARRADTSSTASDAFVRQLAWRDFHHQVLAARPAAAWQDYRPRGDRWLDDEDALAAWRAGQTGIPLVDAGMRQLLAEGWMHNRARLVVASFLTKTLYLDWRAGAAHFFAHLLDGDVANNCLNWQWVAGTGTDTRPNRVLNPLRQAERFDAAGDYVRRYVPELSTVDSVKVHRPWRLPAAQRRGYPPPIVDLAKGRTRFLAARG
ncbi:MAG: DNA photolyase family protein [Pseudonocardiaceae bacterium]|nr:DNA photolyase family protein [Pseudonocardiaceae bacterium]